jgi:hypothetical protein
MNDVTLLDVRFSTKPNATHPAPVKAMRKTPLHSPGTRTHQGFPLAGAKTRTIPIHRIASLTITVPTQSPRALGFAYLPVEKRYPICQNVILGF